MQVDFTIADLATVAGCGAVTLLILQFVVKRILDVVFRDVYDEAYEWRSVIINLSALVVSIALAFLAQAVAGITYETGLQAFLTGLGGAAVAISGYESLKNVASVLRS